MARPPLLILDEPCAGLDPLARENFLAFLHRLGTQHRAPALLFVTHHVEEIIPLFTHTLLLRAGRLQAAGPTARTLTTRHLATTFDTPLRLTRRAARYTLAIPPAVAPPGIEPGFTV